MYTMYGNSHASAHEHAYELAQQQAEEQEAYEAHIQAQTALVLRNPLHHQALVEEAEMGFVRDDYTDRLRLAMFALIADDMDCALTHAAQAKAMLEREINEILRIKTSKRQWRTAQRAYHLGH